MNASIITAPKAPIVSAIVSAQRKEKACRSVAKIAASSQNLSEVSLYKKIPNVAKAIGTMNIRFSPNAIRSTALRKNMRERVAYIILYA